MISFLQTCSRENLNYVLPAAKKIAWAKKTQISLHLPCLSYSFLTHTLVMPSRHGLAHIFLRTTYIPKQQLHPGCQIFSHTTKLKYTNKTQIFVKKVSCVFCLMVHLVYSFHMFANWCRDVYWQYNLKDRKYQQLRLQRKESF